MDTPSGTELIDEYIAAFPTEVQRVLCTVRATVRAAAPDAVERISYRMPAFFQDGVVVYFAAFKKHIGMFPPVADPVVRARASRYAGPKGNLQFPLSEPMPLALITEGRPRQADGKPRASGQQACGRHGEEGEAEGRPLTRR